MKSSLSISPIFKLGVGMLVITLMTARDDAPETPRQKN